MTFGAAFACAYRRDLTRHTRNAIVKRTQPQGQATATKPKALPTTATKEMNPKTSILEEEVNVSLFFFFPWFEWSFHKSWSDTLSCVCMPISLRESLVPGSWARGSNSTSWTLSPNHRHFQIHQRMNS